MLNNLIGTAKAITFTPLNPIEGTYNLADIVGFLVTWILALAGLIAVMYLIYGGILYITAGGDAEKATKGRTAVINSVIGIVIILLAVLIVTWVRGILTGGQRPI